MQAVLTTEEKTAETASVPAMSRKALFQRRTRGALLLALAAFGLSQVALRVLIDQRQPELRDPTFEIKYRQFTRLLAKHRQPPASVVFLGSSMSAAGIDAAMIEPPLEASLSRSVVSYNLAINAAGPLSHLIYVNRMLRRGVRPELVVIELTPLGHDGVAGPGEIQRFPAPVLEKADLDILERYADLPELRGDWWRAQLIPAHGHRLAILNRTARILVPHQDRIEIWDEADDHGWRGREAPSPPEHRQILAEIELQFKARLAKYKMDEASFKALRELAGLLAKERIAVILVALPEGPLMRSFYAPGSTGPVTAEFQAIGRRHGFTFVDARDWLAEDRFRDSYHLQKVGAREFTERLLREAIGPKMAEIQQPAGSGQQAASKRP